MALNNFKCNNVMSLHFKGLITAAAADSVAALALAAEVTASADSTLTAAAAAVVS